MQLLSVAGVLALAASVCGHGAMVLPRPRSGHNQSLDEANKCGSANPYSNAHNGYIKPGEYCGRLRAHACAHAWVAACVLGAIACPCCWRHGLDALVTGYRGDSHSAAIS